MTTEEKHNHADVVISGLYNRSSYHEIPETDLQTELLGDLNTDDTNTMIRFLISESRICRRESRAAQFKSQGNINVVILDDIGLDVATKHKGSYSEYLKSIAEKERREKRTHKWTIIGGIAAVIGAATGLISIGMSLQGHMLKSKSKTEQIEQTPKKEEVEYPHNQYHAIELETSSMDTALPTDTDKVVISNTEE
jgi:hypothetical protein